MAGLSFEYHFSSAIDQASNICRKMQNVLPGSYSINDVDATLHAGFALFHDADSLPGHRSSYVSGLRLRMIFISDERKWD